MELVKGGVMEKRGLSDVVTTVLIILLVLVAIGIIWAAVRPTIENSGSRISGDCLTIQLESVSCTAVAQGYDVVVKRNVGTGNLQGVKLVFSDGTNTQVVENMTSLDELQSATFNSGALSGLTGTVTVRSAAVVGLSGGSSQTCNEETTFATCS